ncbi:helix-turn-helix domain-containing protein [Algoriphagus namhaensis]|uniref:Helix-turn-helix domain-containing protein n=1 Tax=Algoriphagus namhaensis TaxID=915353 RepID=A0ABV8ASJ5_9BACT
MKQPELGKKISELRKAKGLTQEELVEKCNLNVRTIQRIEAGEVSPRSYTIKALFEALDYHMEAPIERDDLADQKTPNYLYAAVGSAVLYFFLSMLEIGFEQEFLGGEASISTGSFAMIKTGSYLFYVIFLLGWVRLLNFFPNGILKIALWLMIGGNAIWYTVDMVALYGNWFSIGDYYMLKVSSFGFLYAFLGAGYLGYKGQFSSVALIMGILLILSGVLLFTGIGAFLALIPWTIGEIVQIGLMVYLIQKIGRKNSPDSSPRTIS